MSVETVAYPYTCCSCGKPTSLGPHATVRAIYRPTCVHCMTENHDVGYIAFEEADLTLLWDARNGTPAHNVAEIALVDAELERRKKRTS